MFKDRFFSPLRQSMIIQSYSQSISVNYPWPSQTIFKRKRETLERRIMSQIPMIVRRIFSRIVTQRNGRKDPASHESTSAPDPFRGISTVSPRDQLIISNAHPRSAGLKSISWVLSVLGRKPTDPRISQTNWDP